MTTKSNNSKPAFLFDVDRTLTNSHQEISKKTSDALRNLQSKGYKLGLSTGRSFATLKNHVMPYFEPKEIHIVSGGAELIGSRGEIIWKRLIPDKVAQQVFQKVIELGAEISFERDDTLFVPLAHLNYYQNHPWHIKSREAKLSEVKNIPIATIYKLSSEIRNFLDQIDEITCKYMPNYEGDIYVDITAKNTTKATAINKWIKYHGINITDVIAFGDSQNDLEVLKIVGHGVAMGNAEEEVKQIADEVIDTHDNEGLAKYLQKFL